MKILILVSIFCFNVSAVEISDCSFVKKSSSSYADVSFNGYFTVKNIELKEGKMLMPVEKYKEKSYENILVASKKAYEKLLSALKEEKCVKSKNSKKPNFKTEKIQKLSSPKRVANADVRIDDDFIVTFGVIKSKDGSFFVVSPKDLEFSNSDYMKELEKDILAKFNK